MANTIPGSDDASQSAGTAPPESGGSAPTGLSAQAESRVAAVVAAAQFHGIELDRRDFRMAERGGVPSPAALAEWARDQGLWAKGVRLRWRELFRSTDGAPIILLFNDGGAGLVIASDPKRNIVWVKDPRTSASDQGVAVDELRLGQVWGGEALLLRRQRGAPSEEAPFTLGWLARMVLTERECLRNIAMGSMAVSALDIVPALLTMVIINKVIQFRVIDTLAMVSIIFAMVMLFQALMSYARREIMQVLGTRIDARLNLHIFKRMLVLPIEYFERNQTGAITHRLMAVFKIRDFLTGKFMQTILDLFALVYIVPLLFYLEPTLAWITVCLSVVIALVIMAFLPAMRRVHGHVIQADLRKATVLVETVHGIRTVKSMALEHVRRDLWDERVAESASWRLRSGRLANWPQTLVMPLELLAHRGSLFFAAYLLIYGSSSITIGGIIAFMYLGGRLSGPLIGVARLMEDLEEARAAVVEVAQVLNNPTESKALTTGLRPKFAGAIQFDHLSFTYPGAAVPALRDVCFEVPPGTMLGIVGRSGSGKSTIARLLQGINREYSGYLKLDGTELREINLSHLRQSFGVVMQDNFLFRGTIRENIVAGRPGLTLDDAIRAARLAGAEEFIERFPAGYDTWVEEGSANLSGGQKQRLAIARALINDPRLLILDEATSALDPESEALVNANLQRIAQGRTMVIISHRLSSLVDCDQILVMEKGTVADIGPHRELVERCSVYRQLWLQQNRHLESAGTRQIALKPVLAEGDD